jgi:selenophosphate synthetase-related protein
MGLLDKAQTLANQGEQAVEKIIDAAGGHEHRRRKAENVVDEVVQRVARAQALLTRSYTKRGDRLGRH